MGVIIVRACGEMNKSGRGGKAKGVRGEERQSDESDGSPVQSWQEYQCFL